MFDKIIDNLKFETIVCTNIALSNNYNNYGALTCATFNLFSSTAYKAITIYYDYDESI